MAGDQAAIQRSEIATWQSVLIQYSVLGPKPDRTFYRFAKDDKPIRAWARPK